MMAFWLAAILSAALAHAQGRDVYPSRPVRMIIPAAPGGNPDVLARMLAKKLADTFGRPFVVENMPGAGGVVAAEAVVKTPPDGYTLFFGDSGALAINVAVNPGISFHPLRDFTSITSLASVPLCISTARRLASVPDVPTAAELGFPGFDVATTIGLQAVAGVPPEIVARLQAAFATALREPDIAERMANLGMELAENGTESYVRYVRQDLERYAAAVKLLGGKVQ